MILYIHVSDCLDPHAAHGPWIERAWFSGRPGARLTFGLVDLWGLSNPRRDCDPVQPSILYGLQPAVGEAERQLPSLQDSHEDHQGLCVGRQALCSVSFPTRSACTCWLPAQHCHPPQWHCGTCSIPSATAIPADGHGIRGEGEAGWPPATGVGCTVQGATQHPQPCAAFAAPEALCHPWDPLVAGPVISHSSVSDEDWSTDPLSSKILVLSGNIMPYITCKEYPIIFSSIYQSGLHRYWLKSYQEAKCLCICFILEDVMSCPAVNVPMDLEKETDNQLLSYSLTYQLSHLRKRMALQ